MKTLTLIATLALLAVPAFADDHASGDVDKGENIFKRCKACHSIVAPDGTAVQKGGKIGPNLFGVIGRPVGSEPDFKYGDGMKEVGAKGLIWDEAMLAAYVADPTGWLREQSGDDKAVAKMTFKLAKGGEDIAAYLATNK
ncbi:MAG: c-type cytochrome [Cypionkella sp.]